MSIELDMKDANIVEHHDDYVAEVDGKPAEVKWKNHAIATLPESLRDLTEEDRKAIETAMLRKIDLAIL
jgi:hypothetical protein